jgi:hypothetical protein
MPSIGMIGGVAPSRDLRRIYARSSLLGCSELCRDQCLAAKYPPIGARQLKRSEARSDDACYRKLQPICCVLGLREVDPGPVVA